MDKYSLLYIYPLFYRMQGFPFPTLEFIEADSAISLES